MSTDLETSKKKITDIYGPWTAHNIQIGDSVSTMGDIPDYDADGVRRIVQIIYDNINKPITKIRVLDLACLEGMYAIELAKQGANAVGIEGREANVAKANFVKDALSLDALKFHKDDVRNLSVEKYGSFDVVLCIGILYHLDTPDVFHFIQRMFNVCSDLLIIDTQVALKPCKRAAYNGSVYHGCYFTEHAEKASREEKEKNLWASLDNAKSFWFTKPSLYNILQSVGFTSVYECCIPHEGLKPPDRVTVVAKKREKALLKVVPDNLKGKLLVPEKNPNPPTYDIYGLLSFIRKVKRKLSV